MADNTTIIPSPNGQLVDDRGNITPVWYQFLTQIFKRTGDESGAVTDITVNAPLSSTGGTTPTITLRLATPALSGAMSATDKAKLDTLTYNTGTWVPALTFDTPGNLAVTYSSQVGAFTQIGRKVALDFSIVTSAFTWSTAAGAMRITGMTIPVSPLFPEFTGSLSWSGITISGSTAIAPQILTANTSIIRLTTSGSNVARAQLSTANTASGTNVTLVGHIEYFV